MPVAGHTLLVTTADSPGVLSQITQVIAAHPANIRSIESLGPRDDGFVVYLELDPIDDYQTLRAQLLALSVVQQIEEPPPLMAIYGKRVIIMGGGAQVGQVAVGAISEADRHNIRGERISVDTIPLVGEEALAAAVRAVARLPRARVLVLAGALDGRRHHRGGARPAAGRRHRHQPQHGRQRARCRRPGGHRPAAGRSDGRHGHRRHGDLRHLATAATAVLSVRSACKPVSEGTQTGG